jgi:hypothetical protein
VLALPQLRIYWRLSASLHHASFFLWEMRSPVAVKPSERSVYIPHSSQTCGMTPTVVPRVLALMCLQADRLSLSSVLGSVPDADIARCRLGTQSERAMTPGWDEGGAVAHFSCDSGNRAARYVHWFRVAASSSVFRRTTSEWTTASPSLKEYICDRVSRSLGDPQPVVGANCTDTSVGENIFDPTGRVRLVVKHPTGSGSEGRTVPIIVVR